MQYARLGRTGLIVSRLALGAMTFGATPDAIRKVSQKEADAIVGLALDSGVNLFNTADMYGKGQSEEYLGHALAPRRGEAVITTKAGYRMGPGLMDQGASRGHLRRAVDASLQRLRTDYIDVLLLHRPDAHTPFEETLETLDELVRSGKVVYAGFSNLPAWQAALGVAHQDARGWARFCAAEMYYSLLCRDIEQEFVDFALACEVGILVWSPLAMGMLTGRYTPDQPDGGGGRLASLDVLPMDPTFAHQVVDKLRSVAAAHGATVAQVAIAWVLAQPHVTSTLVGVSSLRQLEENLGAADLELSEEAVGGLSALTAPAPAYPKWHAPFLRDAHADAALGGIDPPRG